MVILDKIKKIILKEDISNVITRYIIFFMFALPIFYFLGRCFNIDFFLQEEILISAVYILAIVGGCRFYVSKKCYLKTADIFLIILLVFDILATVFSKDIENSVVGALINYSENYIHIISYFALVYMCSHVTDINSRKLIIKAFFVLAVFESIIGILQHNLIWPYLCEHLPEGHFGSKAAFGFTQNCNFFAGLMSLLLGIVVAIFVRKKTSIKIGIGVYISIIISYLAALYTSARIAWLGVAGVFVSIIAFEIVYYIVNKRVFWDRIIKILIVIGSFIVLVLVLDYRGETTVTSQLSEFKEDVEDIDKGESFDKYGSSRGYIWRMGLEAFGKNWIIGIGVDNYEYAFFSNDSYKEGGYYQSRAHCEYLQVLVDEGIFAFVVYMAFILYTFYKSVKYICINKYEKESSIRYILLIAFCAYSIQALVNSSIVNVAPYYWIVIGLLNNRAKENNIYEITLSKSGR